MPNDLAEELLKKTRGHWSFLVIHRRWVVERIFAWLSFYRGPNLDYEFLYETSETLIYTAMIRPTAR
ncbi:hypothetical protein [uncultured Meiothermus sp.]|jgi:transposase|uniref:hypothetical protein n=1 Tax=uncultured Meiothermus sp. TaxID=157471 RepID=UPI002633F05E|nr:hypothetical protein [uncultured Meiothermus sp.]